MADEGLNIERLMLEKLAGVIDEKDDLLLSTLLKENEAYRARYAILKDLYRTENLGKLFVPTRTNQAWLSVARRINAGQYIKRKRRNVWLAAAVTIPLVLLFTGWYLFNRKEHSQRIVADNNIRLFLGNGQSIVLNGQGDTAQKKVGDQVQLNLTKNGLSYSAKDGISARQLNLLEVPLEKTYRVVLADGTTVWLNSKSSLKFPFIFSDSTREVYLNGEAYFKVAKDARHPFIVHTAYTDIKDLGTEFDVNAYDSSAIMTSLVEGLVITSTKEGFSKKLVPGQQALFRPGKDFKVGTFDPESLLSWRNGIYYFNHTPLEQIGPVIYRWFGKAVVFNHPEAASYAFTGAIFKDKSLNEFLENLSITSNITYRVEDDKVYIGIK